MKVQLAILALLFSTAAHAGDVIYAPLPASDTPYTEYLRMTGHMDYSNSGLIPDLVPMSWSILNITEKDWTVVQVDCTLGPIGAEGGGSDALTSLTVLIERTADGFVSLEEIHNEVLVAPVENTHYTLTPTCPDCVITNGEHLVMTVTMEVTGDDTTSPGRLVCDTMYLVDP